MVARVDLSESMCPRQIDVAKNHMLSVRTACCLRRQIKLHKMPRGLDLPGDGHLDQSLVPAWLTAVGGLTLGGWATGILTTKKGNSFCTNQYISIRGCKSWIWLVAGLRCFH